MRERECLSLVIGKMKLFYLLYCDRVVRQQGVWERFVYVCGESDRYFLTQRGARMRVGAGAALDVSEKIDPGCRVKGVSLRREREKWTKKTTTTDTHHAMHAHWQIIINTLVLHVRSPNSHWLLCRSSKINKNWSLVEHGAALGKTKNRWLAQKKYFQKKYCMGRHHCWLLFQLNNFVKWSQLSKNNSAEVNRVKLMEYSAQPTSLCYIWP